MMRAPAARGLSARLLDLLAAGATDVYLLPSDSPAAGRTIRDLALREHTGASILAVVRGQTPHPNPAPDLVLSGGDSLVLMGSHAEVDQAFSYLERLGKGTAAEADDGEGTD
jgi:K+/H+ antiporter YhaU regulatory subunit KhtT